ncbi:MAG TPA: hypothetical protein VHY30_03340 [Verrucomicrobiae bacterium]|jgi:hypothetical protein|nr:hypothetical protein [Verrucomicrobiae bacterium]
MFRRLAMAGALWLACLLVQTNGQSLIQNAHVQVVSVENSAAVTDFQANPEVVQSMVNCGITNFTGKATVAAAWRSLVSTQDVIGIKVFSKPGMLTGTRAAVVAAVIHGLLDAGVPPRNIIIWDKHAYDLRIAGFFKLAEQLGVRAEGGAETGYDPTNFYRPDTAVIGNLVWGDLEFGKTNIGVGRNSFVSKLVSRQITKIISIAPLLNQEDVGVCGHLYSLALGSVDNTRRFEGDGFRLATAVPEIYALPILGDRVVLNITDALIGQYEGGSRSLLHYSSVLNRLWFSRDPVALDMLSIKELDSERRALGAPQLNPNLELYANANLLQLGENNLEKIHVEKIKIP